MHTKAMIFAAGLGTRFKPWTDKHPKALAVINGKSLLQRNIEYLQQYDITDVVVNVHHFADQIIDAVENNKGWGSCIVISDERDEVLETGGGLMKARKLLESDYPFITINADILTDLNISKQLEFHQNQQALISLAVSNRHSSRCFLMDENNRLCGWENKNTAEQKITRAETPLISKAYDCVAVFDPKIFDLIPQHGKFSLTETYLSLAAQYGIMGYEQKDYKFIDVGKPESVEIAEKMFY
jgi:MurNAc alpha-1-phosphate uridylyltransferase